jgi:hypothetical protein
MELAIHNLIEVCQWKKGIDFARIHENRHSEIIPTMEYPL